MHQIFEQYLSRLNAKRVEATTFAKNEHSLRDFDGWLAGHGLDPLELGHVEAQDYFMQLCTRISPASARNNLGHVRSAYRYAIALQVTHRDPTALVMLPKQAKDAEPVTFTNAELRSVIAEARDDREYLAVMMLVYTGMRKREVSELPWSAVDFGANQIRVNGKQGKFRLVPIHPLLREALLEDRRVRPERVWLFQARTGSVRHIDDTHFHRLVAGLLDRASVTGKTIHAFRRTFSSVLYEEGVRESYIEAIMGHAPRTVNARHYRRVLTDDLQAAILQLYASDPLTQSRIAAAV
jgi:integrase